MQKDYYCTRPRLATYLAQKGYTFTITTNVFDPDKKAWVFKNTPELQKDIATYFESVRR